MRFTKAAGGYRFQIEGQTFFAYRDEAGFSHRDWTLYDGETGDVIEDQFATRAECVERAERDVKWAKQMLAFIASGQPSDG
jgi:GH24 family phage-related lysozyme (muramidase)